MYEVRSKRGGRGFYFLLIMIPTVISFHAEVVLVFVFTVLFRLPLALIFSAHQDGPDGLLLIGHMTRSLPCIDFIRQKTAQINFYGWSKIFLCTVPVLQLICF